MNTTRTLIVYYRRKHTSHARLSLTPNWCIVEWGHLKGDSFEPRSHEASSLEEYPELGSLHDGNDWNSEAIWAFFACMKVLDLEQGEPSRVRDLERAIGRLRDKQKAQLNGSIQ